MLVNEDALIEKKVALDEEAIHFPIKVLPVPGGPNNNSPFEGPLRPVKRSLEKYYL